MTDRISKIDPETHAAFISGPQSETQEQKVGYLKTFRRKGGCPCCRDIWGDVAKKNFMSIFQRRQSSLLPLDGIRAIAIIWVLAIHVGTFWEG